jgi:hypothetical protein
VIPLHDPRLDELCRLAMAAAEGRGHDIREWVDERDDGALAKRARCDRCGKPIYVRIEDGMTGMAGGALTQSCD